MKTSRITIGLAIVVWAAAGLAARAEEPAPSAEEPKKTEITADHLVMDYEKMTGYFEGKVVVVDTAMKMESDKLWVTLNQTNQQVSTAKAVGSVKIAEKDRVATADQAEYNANEGKILLVGNAMVKQANNTMQGTKISIWRGDNRVECEKPTMVLFPEKGQSLQSLMP